MTHSTANRPPPHAPLPALFLSCLKIGLTSFGGGLSGLMFREFVTRHGWASEDDFISGLAVAKMIPGPNAVNLLIILFYRIGGTIGAATAAAGFLIGPFFAVIALYLFAASLPSEDLLGRVLSGVSATALGLILLIAVKGVQRSLGAPAELAIIAATAAAIGLFHLPLIPVVLAIAPVSIFLALRRQP